MQLQPKNPCCSRGGAESRRKKTKEFFLKMTGKNQAVSSAPPRENFLILAPRENFFMLAPPENFFMLAPRENFFVLAARENFFVLAARENFFVLAARAPYQ